MDLLILAAIIGVIACEEYKHVTLSSVLKLKSVQSQIYLNSGQLSYQTGSYQQAVTGMMDVSDLNSYWQVLAKDGADTQRGVPIKCGSIVRLKHLGTKKYLHSHQVRSPLTDNQEVSAFGRNGKGDGGDNWYIRCDGSVKFWSREKSVKLEHVDTGMYLAVSGSKFRGAHGHFEIVGVNNKNSPSSNWRADAGVYYSDESDEHSEL
ncbi:Stromal cell-derived factor 2-like protein 1 [Thelohanellus kitauei]|uniref:Stromal cell-derived factor 2-like protein 1 n=1 Tax=Thelohanellus kitauei TaxID=669202 RepID=A0A0C2N5U1_THEKT|nr:Stromal cell-derived factor 2-like protein 1 [Thelohanellus kitauei]